MGWLSYADSGKLAALVMVVVIYFALTGKVKGPGGRLILYTAVGVVLCICPLTAAVLMTYQTRFYDYQWIWSLVPVTAVVALGGTVFLAEQCQSGGGWQKMLRNIIVTAASVLILLFCGGLGEGSVDAVKAEQDRDHAETVLAQVREICGDEVCLWAPAAILEYARLDGEMELLYGRNMWDAALNAYSYDTCSEEQQKLYQWMEYLDDWDIEISVAETVQYVQRGFENGADCILLPTKMSDWLPEGESEAVLLEQLGADESRDVTVLDGYYLVRLR